MFFMIEITNFWGGLAGISAKAKTLVSCTHNVAVHEGKPFHGYSFPTIEECVTVQQQSFSSHLPCIES